jgi:hypothetical protein
MSDTQKTNDADTQTEVPPSFDTLNSLNLNEMTNEERLKVVSSLTREQRLEYLAKLLSPYQIDSDQYKFKFCTDNTRLDNLFLTPDPSAIITHSGVRSGYIVVLKPTLLTKNNEKRTKVIDAKFAKFRGSEFIPVLMIDVNMLTTNMTKITQITQSLIPQGYIGGPRQTDYEIDKVVRPDYYDHNIDKVCTNGIHYFNTWYAALCFGKPTLYEELPMFYDHGKRHDYDEHASTVLKSEIVKYSYTGVVNETHYRRVNIYNQVWNICRSDEAYTLVGMLVVGACILNF